MVLGATGGIGEGIARALHQAGATLPLELTMKLPPTPYARQGGEVIAAMLDKALDDLRKSGELLALFQSHGLTLAAP